MRVSLRIVAGRFRGRKLRCTVHEGLRPTPDMVREALFNILGPRVVDTPFIDVFAGTGITGMEAASRGASTVSFIERDFRLAQDIRRHTEMLGVQAECHIHRQDAYRWARHLVPFAEPVNVFVSPPFRDLTHESERFLELVSELQRQVAPGSVVVVQAERKTIAERLPDREEWEERRYGRNVLLIWEKPDPQV